MVKSYCFFPKGSFLQFVPYHSSPFLHICIFPVSLGRSRRIEHGASLILVRQRPGHPADGMPLHPVQPIPPLFFTDGAVPTCFHTGAFGNENRQALAQSIVGAVAQPLSVGVGIKVECIHYIAISGNRIVRCQMDVLVPMRTTNEDNGIRFYGTNRLDNLHRV